MSWRAVLLAAGLLGSCSDEQAPPAWFSEEAAARGLAFQHRSGARGAWLC